MLRMITWIGVPVLAVALLTGLDSPKAEAGNGFSLQIGRFGISTGGAGYGYNSFYGNRYYGGGFPGAGHDGRRPWYHDTTHLDYHPPELIRHGRHFHVQPGHYDVHRSGHWHH